MLSPFQASIPLSKPRRTNSLAFAKSDCHTCASQGLYCGRQRPRCTTCQSSGQLCQGYSMQLTWQRHHSTVDKPPKVKATISQADNDTRVSLNNERPSQSQDNIEAEPVPRLPREFIFKAGRPSKRRKQHHASAGTMTRKDCLDGRKAENCHSSESSQEPPSAYQLLLSAPSSPTPLLTPTPEECPLQISCPFAATWQTDFLAPDIPVETQAADTVDCETLEQCLQLQQYNISPTAWSPTSPGSPNDLCSEVQYLAEPEYGYQAGLSYIPQMYFPTLHDKFSGLLDMCTCIYSSRSSLTRYSRRWRILQVPSHI